MTVRQLRMFSAVERLSEVSWVTGLTLWTWLTLRRFVVDEGELPSSPGRSAVHSRVHP